MQHSLHVLFYSATMAMDRPCFLRGLDRGLAATLIGVGVGEQVK